jgi:hypothetical protein
MKDLLYDCVFDHEFLFNLSKTLLESLETILDNISKLTKRNEICNFFAFSVEISNNLASVNVPKPKTPLSSLKLKSLKKGRPKVIEKFGISIGNTDINVDSTKVKDIKQIEKNIDQSKVLSGMNKMLSSAINKAASKNQADLIKALAASNKISISKVRGDSFTFTNISQIGKVDTTTEAKFVQEIKNKIINDISVQLKQNIDMVQKDSIKDMNKTSVNEQTGTTVGDILTGVAGTIGSTVGKLADAASSILSINIGNKTENRKEKDITTELKDKFNLNQSFQYKDDNDVKNQLENLLSSDNLAKCAEETKAGGEINLADIDVKGPVMISNIKQEAVINSAMKCLFNQSVLNDISNKIINSQEKLIKQLIENVNDKLTETEKTKVQGDIYAAGTAAAAVIASAGTAVSEAAKGVGEGVGKAAEGVGKGVAIAAEGVGKGVANMFSGLLEPIKGPLMIGAAVAAVGAIIFLIMKLTKKNPSDSSGPSGPSESSGDGDD